jgi:hypothetical protein
MRDQAEDQTILTIFTRLRMVPDDPEFLAGCTVEARRISDASLARRNRLKARQFACRLWSKSSPATKLVRLLWHTASAVCRPCAPPWRGDLFAVNIAVQSAVSAPLKRTFRRRPGSTVVGGKRPFRMRGAKGRFAPVGDFLGLLRVSKTRRSPRCERIVVGCRRPAENALASALLARPTRPLLDVF